MARPSLRVVALSSALVSLLAACGGSPPPEPAAPAPPASAPIAAPPPAPVASAPATTPAPAPEPTAEEKKKAEAAKELARDREKMEADHKAEVARLTPELRAAAKALAEKDYATGKAAIDAAAAGKHRKPGHEARDVYRHPSAMLDFFGFKPTMTVLEFGPGEGWFTELLAPALAKKGKLLATNNDPNGPPDARSTFYGQRFKLFLERLPEAYGKVETVTVDGKQPKLPLEGKVDMVLVFRGMHNMVGAGTLDAWLAEFHKALKPKGVLGVEQHRAKADAKAEESAKMGYLPEKWLVERIEAAGFKLDKQSEMNANPKDTKDHPEGVWTLPPTLELGEKDREKYVAIGESDRMTLKFVKVASKAAPKADAAKLDGPKPAVKGDAKAGAAKPAAAPDATKK